MKQKNLLIGLLIVSSCLWGKTNHIAKSSYISFASPVTKNSCLSNSGCSLIYNTSKDVLQILHQFPSDKKLTEEQKQYLIKSVGDKAIPQFDFELMTRYVFGPAWFEASKNKNNDVAQQKATLIANYKKLLIKLYSNSIANFRGYDMTITSFDKGNKSKLDGKDILRSTVSTVFAGPSRNNDDTYKVIYYLVQNTGEKSAPLVYDVQINGNSISVAERQQFNQAKTLAEAISQVQEILNRKASND